jgi:monofunctional biosynthetic peptidoglycan transglycosylase
MAFWKKNKPAQKKRGLTKWSFIGLCVMGPITWFVITTPDPTIIKGCLTAEMHKVKLCEDDANYVRLDRISKDVRNAILISEDASFFGHDGFDWEELQRSFWLNVRTGHFARGGSTITQQLAKNIFLTGEKSIIRKVREALLAAQIERMFTKQKIFERYLNVIEFGNNIYGIKSAAKKYFNKSPAEIHVLEAAYLAMIIPNPKIYARSFSSGKLTSFGRSRIRDLVYRLYRFGRISGLQYETAKNAIDEFPWRGLSAAQIAGLHGNTLQVAPESAIEITNDIGGSARPQLSDETENNELEQADDDAPTSGEE